VLERALFGDYALIHAWKADTAGNLVFRLAARNFNPVFAMGARHVIVEVEEPLTPAGTLSPDEIHTPGVYVERLVQIRGRRSHPAAPAADSGTGAAPGEVRWRRNRRGA